MFNTYQSRRPVKAAAFFTSLALSLFVGQAGYASSHLAGESAGDSADSAAILAEVLAGDHRSDENKARDQFRHPAEILAFFGMEPDMTVIEITPSAGWYTQVIAPYMARGGGTYYAGHVDPTDAPEFLLRSLERFKEMVSDPVYGDVNIVAHGANVENLVPEGSADMIVTFRNIHNWMPRGFAEKSFADMYKALKPGGILGVVEHRASDAEPQDPKAASGYVREDYAIKLAEDAGFEFVASSPINNNPKDTKDHPFGVWTLPPTLSASRRGQAADEDFDQASFIAIGESDRFALKFVKPAE